MAEYFGLFFIILGALLILVHVSMAIQDYLNRYIDRK